MINFAIFTRVDEYEVIETDGQEERKETGRYSLLVNAIKLPFMPTQGMSLRLTQNSPVHKVYEVMYESYVNDFSVFFDGDFLPVEEFQARIDFLINVEGWQIVESQETKECEDMSTISKKDTSIN